jgi:hypothetical protein
MIDKLVYRYYIAVAIHSFTPKLIATATAGRYVGKGKTIL